MKQRIITGVIGAIVVVLLLLSPDTVVHAAVGVITLYGLFEMYKALEIHKNIPLLTLNLIFAAVVFAYKWIPTELYAPIVFGYIVLVFVMMLISGNTINFSSVALSSFMLAYIVFTMLHIVLLRYMDNGKYLIYLVLLGACGTDVFAYFVGVLTGKHKLCPKISPKKTIEGAVGGIAGAVICYVCFGLVMQHCFKMDVNYVNLLILGVFSGVLSEIGDLAASMIKRQYEIKDYGHLLPGHGGIMDRLDSIIVIAPLVYYFVKYLPVLG